MKQACYNDCRMVQKKGVVKPVTVIQSAGNPLVKELIALQSKKGQQKTGCFIAEGGPGVLDIPKHWPVAYHVFSESTAAKVDLEEYQLRGAVHILSDALFQKVSDTQAPQGFLAVCKQKQYTLEQCLQQPNPLLIFGEALGDPGNVGTLIRTAAAAGAAGVLLSSGSAHIYNPKVVRATAGAIFRIPVLQGLDTDETLQALKAARCTLVAAEVQGATYPYGISLKEGCCLMIGSEAHGLTEQARKLADVRVKIPMASGVESLNASVASGILLYEAVRQRMHV